jgi:hypothetical protein
MLDYTGMEKLFALMIVVGGFALACSGDDPVSPEQRLAGRYDAVTWTIGPGDVVGFDMEGDTFVRFVEWQFGAGRLENEFTIGQYTTRTVLRR